MRRGQITGWAGLVRVDGKSYTWMGSPSNVGDPVTQTNFEYTTTRSVFTMNVAEKVEMNVTFLSPIYPDDQKRQSLVFTYLDVAVQSLDGNSHAVQLYADISGGISRFNHVIFVQPQLMREQNGLLETIQLLPSGTMLPRTASYLTRSGDKSSCNLARPTSKLTGVTGTGARKTQPASLIRVEQTSTSEAPFLILGN